MPHRPRLVLAHGDRLIRSQLETRFILAGYAVSLAATGGEARAMLRQEGACLVLDLQIPGRSALEVLAWMSKAGRTARTPVLGLTAGIDPGQLRAAVAWGMDDCLRAPFDELAVVERVRRLVVKYQVRSGAANGQRSAFRIAYV